MDFVVYLFVLWKTPIFVGIHTALFKGLTFIRMFSSFNYLNIAEQEGRSRRLSFSEL